MKYKISDLQKARSEFKNVFDLGLNEYLEKEITAITGFLVINIVDFYKFLEKQSKEKEASFDSLLLDKYGQKGIELIKKLTL